MGGEGGPAGGEGWIEPTPVVPLSGEERFSETDATVADFWRWGFSDLRENILRGVMAEFLVARALGTRQSTRAAWDNYDVLSPTGIRVEVKSSAYLQSWSQRRLSSLRFSGLSGLTWEPKQGWGGEREYRADVFVFAVQTCREPEHYDPLDTGQWEFYAVPARTLREYGARSVGLGFLDRVAEGPRSLGELARAVEAAYRAQTSGSGG